MTRAVGVELKIHAFLLSLIATFEREGQEEQVQAFKKAERWYAELPQETREQFTALLLKFVVIHPLQDPSVEVPEDKLSDLVDWAKFQPKPEPAKQPAAQKKDTGKNPAKLKDVIL